MVIYIEEFIARRRTGAVALRQRLAAVAGGRAQAVADGHANPRREAGVDAPGMDPHAADLRLLYAEATLI